MSISSYFGAPGSPDVGQLLSGCLAPCLRLGHLPLDELLLDTGQVKLLADRKISKIEGHRNRATQFRVSNQATPGNALR